MILRLPLILAACFYLCHGMNGAGGYNPESALQQLQGAIKLASNPLIQAMVEARLRELAQKDPVELLEDGLAFLGADNVTKKCTMETGYLLENVRAEWAMRVFDSWAKIESGVMEGNFNWLGDFDECLSISNPVTLGSNYSLPNDVFDTRYCTVDISTVILNMPISIKMASCVPRGCQGTDVASFYGLFVEQIFPGAKVGAICKIRRDERVFYTGNMVAFVTVCVLMGICCLATLLEKVLLWIDGCSDNGDSKKRGLLTKTILSFSFYSNAKKILDTKQPPGAIKCINGIRFFSMSWVILGHTVLFYSANRMKNSKFALNFPRHWTAKAITQGNLSVDSFFVLSGVLVGYLFLKDFERRKMQFKGLLKAIPLIYIQRYIRLTPAYGITILIWVCLVYFVSDGPYWPQHAAYPQAVEKWCPDYWWWNLLYINNFRQHPMTCTGWGWYLANDFQFFLVAPFVVFLFYKRKIAGSIVAVLMVLGSNISNFIMSWVLRDYFSLVQYNGKLKYEPIDYVPTVNSYSSPWTRYQSYGVGLIAGLVIFELKKREIRIPKVLNSFLWLVAAGLCLAPVYGPHEADLGHHDIYLVESTFFNALARTSWSLGLSYLIVACALGQGDWINELLSWKAFVPLSRLTYCGYLIHIPIVQVYVWTIRTRVSYSEQQLIGDFLLFLVLAMFGAFAFSLCFEMPFINLDKLYITPLSIKGDRKKSKTEQKMNESKEKLAENGVNESAGDISLKTYDSKPNLA